MDTREPYEPAYGDLTKYNIEGLILEKVGKERLSEIVEFFQEMLETSAAVYEKNGDYAYGLFSSAWCRVLDNASRKLCGGCSDKQALESGLWLCHESCWNGASKVSIMREEPIDIECHGGIRMYAVPIKVRGETVGSINFGYGTPPRDRERLEEISEKYKVPVDILESKAEEYHPRPAYIIEAAKRRLEFTARLIGEMIENKLARDQLIETNSRLYGFMNAADDGILILDKDLRILEANDKWLNRAMVSRDVFGTRLDILFPRVGESGRAEGYRRVAETGEPVEFLNVEAPSGIGLVYHIKAFKTRDGVALISRNITDHVKNEKHIEYLYQVLLAIRNVNQLIVTEKNREILLKKSCDLLVESKGYQHARIMIKLDDEKVRVFDSSNINSRILDEDNCPCNQVLSSEEVTVFSEPEETCKGCPLYTGSSGYSVLGMKLSHEAQEYGYFTAAVPVDMIGEEELSLFQEVAGDIAYALYAFDLEEQRAKAVAELSASEENYRNLFENLLGGYAYHRVVFDDFGKPIDFIFLDVNEKFEEYIGKPKENIIGKRVTEVLTGIEDDPADWIGVYGHIASTNGYTEFENYLEPLQRWYQVRAYSPEEGYFATIVYDITNEKIAEQELRESQTRLEDFVKSSTDAILLLDNDFNIIDYNPTWKEWSQITDPKEEIVGKNIIEILPNTTGVHQRTKLYREVIETGSPISLVDVPSISRKDTFYDINAFKVGNGIGITLRNTSERKRLIDKLAREEAEKEAILDAIPDTISLKDDEFRFVWVNKAVTDMLGLPEEEIIGKTCYELAFNKEKPCDHCKLKETIETQEINTSIRPTVDDKIIDAKTIPITYPHGEQYILEISRDITSQVETEKQLKENQEKLLQDSIILENVNDSIIVTDMEGNISYWNHGAEEVWGYTADEMMGGNVADLYLNPVELDVELEQVIDGTFSENTEWRGKRKDDSEVVVLIRSEVMHDLDDKPVGMIGVSKDITRLKEAEEAFETQRKRLEGFVNSATDGFSLLDKNMRYLMVNDKELEYSRREREEYIGKHIKEVLPNLPDNRYNGYKKVLETGEPVYYKRAYHQKETDMYFDYTGFRAGDTLGILSRDVTNQVKYEIRLEALYNHATELSSAETEEEIAKITKQTLSGIFGFNRGSLALVEGMNLIHRYRWGAETTEPFYMPLDGPGVTVRVVHSGETIHIKDVTESELYVQGKGDPGTYSELAVPVKVHDNVIAVINLESIEKNAYDKEDIPLVELLANQVGSALTRQAYSKRLNAIHRFSIKISDYTTFDAIANEALSFIDETFGFPYASIGVIEENNIHFKYYHGANLEEGFKIPLSGKGITVRAVNVGETQFVEDVSTDPDHYDSPAQDAETGEELHTISEIVVPIKSSNQIFGVINIESPYQLTYSSDTVQLLELLAENIEARLTAWQLETERIRAEQAEEIKQIKTRFVSTATHELRTPLTSIKGYLELMQNEEMSTEAEKYHKIVYRNAERLESITEDLLDQQRIEEGRFRIDTSNVNVKKLLENTVEEISRYISERNQEVRIKIPPKKIFIEADENRLSQVLINLLSNASKYSPENSDIELLVENNNEQVTFSVRDGGYGLAAAEIDELFKPFPNIETRPVSEKSVGLGLSISKGIVELHGGNIWAESEGRGKGSTFTFTIPIHRPR